MICSAREMGMGDDHAGIVVLPDGSATVGSDAIELLGLRDSVIDVAVTPDRGYALSMRGIAREVAIAFKMDFEDPISRIDSSIAVVDTTLGSIEESGGADRLVLRRVTGLDASARSPLWLQRRLTLSGMRPISLAVDITNYVMLELGQPLHAFDGAKIRGGIQVRFADEGEQLETLDHVIRNLDSDDLVIAANSGPLALAGTMGGLTSEIDETSTEVLLEAAHFRPEVIARMSRRHKLSSEASRRFERGVDHELGSIASARAAELFCKFGSAKVISGLDLDQRVPWEPIALDPEYPSNLVGHTYQPQVVAQRLEEVGCVVDQSVSTGVPWRVQAPSWRPDLTLPEDLVEEIARLEGYEVIPSLLPSSPASRGFTQAQLTRRRVGVTLAGEGLVEILSYPFIGNDDLEGLGIGEDDPRYPWLRLANPISETAPFMRTTLLPGLIAALKRNLSRGSRNLALFEMGSIFVGVENQKALPHLGVDRAPSANELADLMDRVPSQPQYVSGLFCGASESSWLGSRKVGWNDAISSAQAVARAAGAVLTVKGGTREPWHSGRCAELWHGDSLVGHAGELHPRVIAAFDLPERTVAFEINLDALGDPAPVLAPEISTYPPAVQDIALVVAASVSASEVTTALLNGGKPLLESAVLFDVYVGEQIGSGRKSLAFTLTFRAEDRTLTAVEAAEAREGAVAAAAKLGAELRDGKFA